MQTAMCHQDGAIYNAPSFGSLNPDEIEQKRGLLSCPGCRRHSYFRKEARNGRAPCFCAHHDPGCEFAAASPMARSESSGLGRFSSNVLDKPIVVDFSYGSWDGGVQGNGRQPVNSSLAANPSGQMQGGSSAVSSHRRLSTLLRNILEVPDFVQSPQALYVQGIGQTRVCDFFVNFRQINQTHLGQLMGHWGALSSVGQGNSGELWLNTGYGGSGDVSICVPAHLINALYERHAIHSGSAWEPESCFALVVGTVHLSQGGKPYIEVADLCNVAVLQRGASAGQR
jgi:hypothetical protein